MRKLERSQQSNGTRAAEAQRAHLTSSNLLSAASICIGGAFRCCTRGTGIESLAATRPGSDVGFPSPMVGKKKVDGQRMVTLTDTPLRRRDTARTGHRRPATGGGAHASSRHAAARGGQGHAPAPEVLSRVPDPVPLGAARFPPARRGSPGTASDRSRSRRAWPGGRARALPLQEYVHAGQPRRHTTCVQMGETETQPKGLAATMHPGRRRRARFPARGGRVARARSLRRARGRASRAVCSRCTSLVDSSPRHSHDSALAWRAACAHCRHARA